MVCVVIVCCQCCVLYVCVLCVECCVCCRLFVVYAVSFFMYRTPWPLCGVGGSGRQAFPISRGGVGGRSRKHGVLSLVRKVSGCQVSLGVRCRPSVTCRFLRCRHNSRCQVSCGKERCRFLGVSYFMIRKGLEKEETRPRITHL